MNDRILMDELELMEAEEETELCVNMQCVDCKWYSNRYCEKFYRPADPSDDLCAYGITRL